MIPNATTHEGTRIPSDADFFAPPPPEIGVIVSASTTLRRGDAPRSAPSFLEKITYARNGLLLGAFFGIIPPVALCRFALKAAARQRVHIGNMMPTLAFVVAVGAIAGAAAGGLIFYHLGARRRHAFTHSCTYVGRDGVARASCVTTREQQAAKALRFSDAAGARVTESRGSFKIAWTDEARKPLFSIMGVRGSPEHAFATAARKAWIEHGARRGGSRASTPSS